MTERDFAVRDWIATYQEKHEGMSPTQLEIAKGLGVTRRTVENAIVRLEQGGFVQRTRNARRGVRVPGVTLMRMTAVQRLAKLEERVAALEARG